MVGKTKVEETRLTWPSRHDVDAMPDAATELSIPRCTSCGYNLTGLESAACPECGQRICSEAWREEVAYAYRLYCRYQLAAHRAYLAIALALGGVGLFGLRLLDAMGHAAAILRWCEAGLGIGAIFLGGQTLRIPRMPSWVKATPVVGPRYGPSIIAVALGLLGSILASRSL